MRRLSTKSYLLYLVCGAFILFIFWYFGATYSSISSNYSASQLQEDNTNSGTSSPWWEVKTVSCPKIFHGDEDEIARGLIETVKVDKAAGADLQVPLRDELYRGNKESCESYLRRRHFLHESQSEEERNFGIAYSVLVFKDYVQVEKLLRALHRPEHVICIHADPRADASFLAALYNLVRCFPSEQVFLYPNPIPVFWGTFSVLKAELLCMETLWKYAKKWRFFINLTGQEFPLRSNLELVRILKALNGSNAMEGTVARRNMNRFPKAKMPFPLTWVKGSVHIVVQKGFVDFCLHNEKSKAILAALEQDSNVPDETFFATLNHNPQLGAPGAYLGEPETDQSTYPFIVRLKNWFDWPFKYPCRSGRSVRQICIWGVADLPFIFGRYELFVNKFHWDFQHVAWQCMQEWYWRRTESQAVTGDTSQPIVNKAGYNISWYASLKFTREHV